MARLGNLYDSGRDPVAILHIDRSRGDLARHDFLKGPRHRGAPLPSPDHVETAALPRREGLRVDRHGLTHRLHVAANGGAGIGRSQASLQDGHGLRPSIPTRAGPHQPPVNSCALHDRAL